jgi:hypothetical protein
MTAIRVSTFSLPVIKIESHIAEREIATDSPGRIRQVSRGFVASTCFERPADAIGDTRSQCPSHDRDLRADSFYVSRDLHLIANEHSTGFQSCIPHQPEVFPIQFGRCRCPNSLSSPGILDFRRRAIHVERNLASYDANG